MESGAHDVLAGEPAHGRRSATGYRLCQGIVERVVIRGQHHGIENNAAASDTLRVGRRACASEGNRRRDRCSTSTGLEKLHRSRRRSRMCRRFLTGNAEHQHPAAKVYRLMALSVLTHRPAWPC